MSFYCFNDKLETVELAESWFRQRSFLYGDGHFTTALVEQGKIVSVAHHVRRLIDANKRLRFNDVDVDGLVAKLTNLVKLMDLGILKIQIDRGMAVRGYGNTLRAKPTIFVWLTPLQTPMPQAPVTLTIVQQALGLNPLLAGLKHTNRLEQALIANELEQLGYDDGLVSDINGMLVETNKANVFWCERGQWFTPDLTNSGVNGTMRQQVLAQLKDVKIVSKPTAAVIAEAEAMVVTNALIKLVPVAHINDNSLDVQLAQQFIEKFSL